MSDEIEEMKDQSIIHGTLRPQDLVPEFILAALHVGGHGVEYKLAEFLPSLHIVVMDDDNPWWDSEECAEVLNDLVDLLNDYAPEGYYFGAHPGDGSDFGFWENDDED